MVDLVGKPIAITGASSGIGLATALACAQAGMHVAVGARREDKLQVLVERINTDASPGRGRAIAVRMNVDDPDDCRRLVDQTVEAFGSIYGIIANAGYSLERAVQDTPDDELRAIFETNFFGSMNTIRPALERMAAATDGEKATGRGHIIIVSSCLSKLGTPFHAAYSATKAAQDHIARAMRLELADRGIFVSSVHPIGTKTELFHVMDRRSGGSAALHTPEFFMQSPERVARGILAILRRPRGVLGLGRWGGGEVWTSAGTRLLMALGIACPGIADLALRVHVARRDRHWRPAAAEQQKEAQAGPGA